MTAFPEEIKDLIDTPCGVYDFEMDLIPQVQIRAGKKITAPIATRTRDLFDIR